MGSWFFLTYMCRLPVKPCHANAKSLVDMTRYLSSNPIYQPCPIIAHNNSRVMFMWLIRNGQYCYEIVEVFMITSIYVTMLPSVWETSTISKMNKKNLYMGKDGIVRPKKKRKKKKRCLFALFQPTQNMGEKRVVDLCFFVFFILNFVFSNKKVKIKCHNIS